MDREISSAEGYSFAKWLSGDEFAEISAREDDYEKTYEVFCDIVRKIRAIRKLKAQIARPTSASAALPPRQAVQKRIMSRNTLNSLTCLFPCSRQNGNSCGRNRRMDEMTLNSPLIRASRTNDQQGVERYPNRGTGLDGQTGSGDRAIHAAAACGDLDMVDLLLIQGVSINSPSPGDITPLQLAAFEGHIAIVQLLLDKGARIDEMSRLHGTALLAAVAGAKPDVVRFLLERGADVHTVGGPYGNALRAAAVAGNSTVMRLLLTFGIVSDVRK